MKDSQKRWKSNSTESVIAALMGFDELRSTQPPFHENHRVLSESYTRKVASIALRPGSLVSSRRSCSTDDKSGHNSQGKNDKVVSECVNSSTSNVRTSGRSSKRTGASLSKPLSRHRYEVGKSFGKKGEHFAGRRVLRYQQKLEHDSLGVDYTSNSLNFPLEFDVHSRPADREKGRSLMPEIGKPHHGFTYNKQVVNGIVSPRRSCIACIRNTNRFYQHESRRSKFEDVLGPGYKSYSHDPHLLLDQSSSPNKHRKHKFERAPTEEVREFGVSGRNQTPALIDKKSLPRNSDTALVRSGLCSPSSLRSTSSPSVFSSVGVVDGDCLKRLPDSEYDAMRETFPNGWNLRQDESSRGDDKSKVETTSQEVYVGVDAAMSPSSKVSEFSSCDFSCFGSPYKNPEAYIQSVRDQIDNCFEYSSCKEMEPTHRNSKSSITTEASMDEFSEDEAAYANTSCVGPPVSPENVKRTNQHSPDSVLEQFDIKKFPSFECFDSIGLRLQLEALNSEETQSEGSVMAVSCEGDSEGQLGGLSRDGRKVKIWLRDEETRSFSYLVDVLDESGFFGTNSFMDFKAWTSLECLISPSVFDKLEKKYGKQTSWEKSERQLLFDRINSGLLSIFSPAMNFHAGSTSVRKKLRSSFRRDELEEELWMMLISQEDEKTEMALDQWLESEEGISIICGELETSLFDELVMELASLWNSYESRSFPFLL